MLPASLQILMNHTLNHYFIKEKNIILFCFDYHKRPLKKKEIFNSHSQYNMFDGL